MAVYLHMSFRVLPFFLVIGEPSWLYKAGLEHVA